MKYDTIITHNSVTDTKRLLDQYRDSLMADGNVFCLLRNEYGAQGDVEADFLDVIRHADNTGWAYVNTIVVPTERANGAEIPDNVLYVVWLAKDRKLHYFNKDAIREPHIWKDVEWGHRAKNYNPKGKDPGNVWIPTEDDGRGNITRHILMSLSDVVKRLYDCSHRTGNVALFVSDDSDDEALCVGEMTYLRSGNHTFSPANPHVFHPQMAEIATQPPTAQVVWGSSEDMSAVNDDSVDVIVTSPPYWDLKDYFKEGQIGQEDYEVYLSRMETVWCQCFRKLRQEGSLWININIRVKANKLILIPEEFVRQCRAIGFHYKGILIWHKSSGIPTHDKNIVDRHEYVLVFSKGSRLNVSSQLQEYADYCNEYMNGGAFWNINRKAGSVGKHFVHPAIYPNQLVERIVASTTVQGGVVLDPFLGSGTTLIATALLGRNSIGYEYNEGFCELIQSRLEKETVGQNCIIRMDFSQSTCKKTGKNLAVW